MKSRATILILGAAQFVMVLDTTVMNVSISEVVADLDTTVPQVQLAITAYALVMAAFMLTGAKLGDMYGRRKIFAIGLGIYGTGSFITAISPNVEVLLLGWSLIEGLGACLVIPSIAALTAANYSGKERAMAYGLLGGIAGAGVAAGPLIGGFVTTVWTWRIVFAAETLVVAAILVFGISRIKTGPSVEREKLDLVGAALSAIGLGLVVFGILKSSEWGLFQPTGALVIGGEEITPFGLSAVPFIVAAGIVFLGLFRSWERRLESRGGKPLLRPGMLQVPQLRGGLTMFVSSYLLMAGTFFVLPLYLQLVIGDNTLETGIKILPVSVAMMIAAVAGSRAADRVSPKRIVRIGLLLLFVGLLGAMATIDPDLNGAALAISLAFFGGGVGLIVSQLGNVVMSSVGEDKASEAGGLQGAAQSLGSSLGTALIGAILLAGLTSGLHDAVRADSSIPPKVQEQIVAGTEQGVPMVSSETAEDLATEAGLTADEVTTVVDHYEDVQIDALKRAFLGASFFALFAFWIAGDLPGAPLGASGPTPDPRGREPAALSA
ncbi:MAG TPA: MFS transporter [Solirubrobacterales bacterium]|nr:MFS transporter [Solirubrobacterales bacterium]